MPVFVKKNRPTRQKVFPHPTLGAPSASNSPSALSARERRKPFFTRQDSKSGASSETSSFAQFDGCETFDQILVEGALGEKVEIVFLPFWKGVNLTKEFTRTDERKSLKNGNGNRGANYMSIDITNCSI